MIKYALWTTLIFSLTFFNLSYAKDTSSQANTMTSSSQVKNPNIKRPKIGLVLAGGGAKGLSHIGVIKALEAQHIPIDYIAGTSMGALVGGLYAAGLSSAEVETFATELNWDQSLEDSPSREYISFRRKQDQYDYFVRGELGMKDWQLSFPSGLLQGQQQYNLLEDLILFHTQKTNFNELPIPFRAVATDIETGDAVILKQGSLSKALRASMSVPGVFTPVEINNKLLVDGGLVNNTPIDIARQMGADIIIVSDIHSPRSKRESLTSFIKISDQILSGLTLNNTLAQLDTLTKKDIHLRPDLKDFGSADFNQVTNIIKKGEEAVIKQQAKLDALKKKLGFSEDNLKAIKKHQTERITPIIHQIEIENTTELSNTMIERNIQQKINTPLDRVQLRQDLSYLYGMGHFELITFSVERNNQVNTLKIKATPPSWGPNFFKLKFNLASNLYDSNNFNIGLRHTYMPTNSMGAEWRNEFQIGEVKKLRSEFYQPLTDTHEFYIKPYIDYSDQLFDFVDIEDPNNLAIVRLEQTISTAGLDIGYNLSSNLNISTSAYLEHGELALGPKSAQQIKQNYDDHILAIKLSYDTLNQVTFPEKGSRLSLSALSSADSFGSTHQSQEWAIDYSTYHSIGRHTFNFFAEYNDLSTKNDDEIHRFYTLGGFQNLSGYAEHDLIGDKKAFSRIKYQYRVSGESSSLLNFPFYIGGTLEAGNTYNQNAVNENKRHFSFDNTKQAGSIFVGMNSILGPVYLAYGYHNATQQSVYLYFGRRFD